MAVMGVITAACVLLCLALLDSAHGIGSAGSSSCCKTYSHSAIPFSRITGVKKQNKWENCDIDAIIFYTVKKGPICTTIKDEWVRRTLNLLRKMAKVTPAAGNHSKGKTSDPVAASTSGNTTESSLNITESFYNL